jgi:hypothetical protein
MNPKVGLTVLISSFMILLTIVVLPALSSPLIRSVTAAAGALESVSYSINILISLSLSLAFLRIDSILIWLRNM